MKTTVETWMRLAAALATATLLGWVKGETMQSSDSTARHLTLAAAEVGAGAAAGAIVGKLIGKDGKGAVIGGIVGAGAGAAAARASRDIDIVLPKGAAVTLKLDKPLTVKRTT